VRDRDGGRGAGAVIHTVRDGRHILRFNGEVLATGTSARARAVRWSEIVVYRLVGGYLLSRVGYSVVAHRPECERVNIRMVPWIDLEDRAESVQQREPCLECQPSVGAGMDPQTMIETTIYSAQMAPSAPVLGMLLTKGRPAGQLPRLVCRVAIQCCEADDAFARYWSTLSPVTSIRTP
jgi:hypothetical protein